MSSRGGNILSYAAVPYESKNYFSVDISGLAYNQKPKNKPDYRPSCNFQVRVGASVHVQAHFNTVWQKKK